MVHRHSHHCHRNRVIFLGLVCADRSTPNPRLNTNGFLICFSFVAPPMLCNASNFRRRQNNCKARRFASIFLPLLSSSHTVQTKQFDTFHTHTPLHRCRILFLLCSVRFHSRFLVAPWRESRVFLPFFRAVSICRHRSFVRHRHRTPNGAGGMMSIMIFTGVSSFPSICCQSQCAAYVSRTVQRMPGRMVPVREVHDVCPKLSLNRRKIITETIGERLFFGGDGTGKT